MRKTPIIAFGAITLGALVIFACNKLSPQPEDTKAPDRKKLVETHVGRISSSTTVTMVVEEDGGTIEITTSSSPAAASDKYNLFSPPSGVTIHDNDVYLEENALAWWLVPFDATKAPVEMVAGPDPSMRYDCYCAKVGEGGESSQAKCELKTTNGCTTCNPADHSSCVDCNMTVCDYRISASDPWVSGPSASYRLINADEITYNGVTYTRSL